MPSLLTQTLAAALAAVVPIQPAPHRLPSPLYGTPRQILAAIAAAKAEPAPRPAH